MADSPWRNKKLTPGQQAQELARFGCEPSYLEDAPAGTTSWKITECGEQFVIASGDCDGDAFGEIIEWVKQKIEKKRGRKN